MNAIPHHQPSAVNPEQVTSEINAAYAAFLAAEPTTPPTLFTHHQENVDTIPLTTEIIPINNDLLRTSRPPTPYTITTNSHSDSPSSSSSTTDSTNLPRYKTRLDKYAPNNDQSSSTTTTSNSNTLLRNFFNSSTSSTNRRKRSVSNEYNTSKRIRSLQSSTGKLIKIIFLNNSLSFKLLLLLLLLNYKFTIIHHHHHLPMRMKILQQISLLHIDHQLVHVPIIHLR
jgi:hypothetical protein